MASPAAVLNILLTANTTQASAALAKAQGELTATSKTAGASSAAMKKGFAVAGAAAIGAASAVFKLGEAFDDAYDTIQTRTGATGKQLDKLEGSFKKVLTSVPTNFGDAADAVAGLNQRLGLTGKPLTKLSRQVTALSKVTGTDVQENVESLTRLFGDWSVKTEDQASTMDGLFRVSQKTGSSVSDLARQMVQFGAPLRNLGFGIDQAAALFGAFEKTGVNMTTVMSGLRLSVGNFAKPTADLAATMKRLNLSANDTPAAVAGLLKAIKDTGSESKATALAIDAFGKRAGPDLVDTVRGGKFELQALMKTFQSGDVTIRNSERQTRDFSEQWTLFKNQIAVIVEPVASGFFKLVGEGMKAINKLDLKGIIQSLKDFWQSATFLRDVVGKVWDAIKAIFRGGAQTIGGIVRVLSGVLTGDFGRAWDGVKSIFSGAIKGILATLAALTAPFRAAIEAIAHALKTPLDAAMTFVKKVFAKGADFILGVITTIVDGMAKMADAGSHLPGPFGDAFDKIQAGLEDTSDAINKSREDIRNWANSATLSAKQMKQGVSTSVSNMANAVTMGFLQIGQVTNSTLKTFGVDPVAFSIAKGIQGKQTGGVIVPGQGSGDKVPAMLEPGEVVWNKKAVAAMGGASSVNQMNKAIPRFQGGGVVGDVSPVTLAGPSGALRSLGQAALDLVRNAANKYIDKKAAVAGPTGTGGPGPGGVGTWMGFPMANWVIASLRYAAAKGVRPQPTSGYRTQAEQDAIRARDPRAAKVSEHTGTVYPHGAVDFGGFVDPAAYVKKMAVVNATKSFKWPLLAPIGFSDDGHASGTGHMRGGIIQKLAGGGDVIGRPIPAALQKYNHLYAEHNSASGDWGGPTMPVNDIAMLAEFFGMPGISMAQIAHGESGYRPGATGVDPGGTKGYGLWMITTSFNDAIANQLGGYPQLLNPIKNAIAASKAFKARGLAPWYGTRYLTDTNAHYAGAGLDHLSSAAHPHNGGAGSSGGGGGSGPKPLGPNQVNPLWWQVLDPTSTSPTSPGSPWSSPWAAAFKKHLKLPDKLARQLYILGTAASQKEEELAMATRLAGFASSPSGNDLSPEERADLVAKNQALLTNYVYKEAVLKKAIDWLLPQAKGRARFITELGLLEGSQGLIIGVKETLDTLLNPAVSDITADTTQLPDTRDEQIALLRDLLSKANLRTAVSQLQYPVLRDFAGMFGSGGKIGAGKWGIAGENGAEIVHGPAAVVSPGQTSAALGPPRFEIHINGDISNVPPGKQPVEIKASNPTFRAEVEQVMRGKGRRPLTSSRGL